MKRLIFTVFASVILSVSALAAVVDFEPFPGPGNPILTTPTAMQGLTFTSAHYHILTAPGSCGFGGCVAPAKYLGLDGPTLGLPVTVTPTGGGTFSVFGLDASELWADGAAAAGGGFPNADFLHLVGNLNGGGVVVADLPLAFGFAGFALAGFVNLDSLVISGFVVGGTPNASWAVDNIVWDTFVIPEPSTFLLVGGAGILALMVRRRR